MIPRAPRLVLLGKQGAGKGTQAGRLAQHYGVVHLSTGELFRLAAQAGTLVGLEAQRYMDRGELVPDELVMGVVEEHLSQEDGAAQGFVLDGFPRNRFQAVELDRVLEGHPLELVVDLEVPDAVVLDRLAGRRVCEQCGTTYHDPNILPAHPDICDVCGGRVVQRDDDTEPSIRRRLELYGKETVPVIDFYRRQGKLVVVDGVGTGDEVFERLSTAVDANREPSHAR